MRRNDKIRLAGNLKSLMEARRLTITSLSKQTGMNKSTLHNYLNGVVPRNLVKIKELADALEVSLLDLVFGETPAPARTQARRSLEGRFEVTVRRVQNSEPKH